MTFSSSLLIAALFVAAPSGLALAAEGESTALIVRSKRCEAIITHEDLAQSMIEDGTFSDDAIGRNQALVVASQSMIANSPLSPENIDPSLKNDLVYRTIFTVLQERAGSAKTVKNREALDGLVDDMNDKGRLAFANIVVHRLFYAVDKSRGRGAALGLANHEVEALSTIDIDKAVELRNWIFIQLSAKGPLYTDRLAKRFGFWGSVINAFRRRPNGENPLSRLYSANHWNRIELAVNKPASTDLELAKSNDRSFSQTFPTVNRDKELFVRLYWRQFSKSDISTILGREVDLSKASIDLLEARQKELKFLEYEGEFMRDLTDLAKARATTKLPRLEFDLNFPAGKVVLNNLRIYGRDLTFDELRGLFKYNYKFNLVKAGLPDGLLSELIERMDDLEKIDSLWSEYTSNEAWKPSVGQQKRFDESIERIAKTHAEAQERLEKEREALVTILTALRTDNGASIRKNNEQVLEELFAATMEVQGLPIVRAISEMFNRYEEALNPFTTVLTAAQMQEIFPLAIRKMTRLVKSNGAKLYASGWIQLMEIFHELVIVTKLERNEVEAIKETLAETFEKEVRPLIEKDTNPSYQDLQTKVLEPYFERSWMQKSKPIDALLQEKIAAIETKIQEAKNRLPDLIAKEKLSQDQKRAQYLARKAELQEKIEALEAKLGPYESPNRPR